MICGEKLKKEETVTGMRDQTMQETVVRKEVLLLLQMGAKDHHPATEATAVVHHLQVIPAGGRVHLMDLDQGKEEKCHILGEEDFQ